MNKCNNRWNISISTHSLTRRLTLRKSKKRSVKSFQLTASQGGWPSYSCSKIFLQVFQLTASQGGWRVHEVRKTDCRSISTHSLTRRLTSCPEDNGLSKNISTHSLTRRLTDTAVFDNLYPIISTHSLTRRLTIREKSRKSLLEFQLTASQGGWPNLLLLLTLILIFQLTASQGGWRQSQTEKHDCNVHFNSQPHKEADYLAHAVVHTPHWISTHSLTRRLTLSPLKSSLLYRYFNSQPHKEADSATSITSTVRKISTHSLTRRLTRMNIPSGSAEIISTHSLTRRLTSLQRTDVWCILFQLTASQGGWRRRTWQQRNVA